MDTVVIILAPLAGLPQWFFVQLAADLCGRLKLALQFRRRAPSRDRSPA